jgi:hypothetical protein
MNRSVCSLPTRPRSTRSGCNASTLRYAARGPGANGTVVSLVPTRPLKGPKAGTSLSALRADRGAFGTVVLRWAVLLTALSGCADDLPEAWQVTTLRVLAIRQESTPTPGETLGLTALWTETREDRVPQLAWFPPCWNPRGGSFAACFGDLRATDPSTGALSTASRVDISVPDDVLIEQSDGTRVGTGFVFFVVCNGALRPTASTRPSDVPFDCVDESGNPLGSDDYVFSFATVTVEEDAANVIPSLVEVQIDGRTIPLDCAGDDCVDAQSAIEAIDCEDGEPRCVDVCSDPKTCEATPIAVTVAPDSLEELASGEPETAWVRAYTTGRELDKELDVVSTEETSAGFELKAETDETMRFWVTLHDARGGASWASFRLRAR